MVKVPVPRKGGTTATRGATEFRMMHSDEPWSCQISIRRELDTGVVNEQHSTTQETNFGPRLSDCQEVELMIKRAQVAALNSRNHGSDFCRMNEEELETYMPKFIPSSQNYTISPFTRNVICVNISGPDLEDLSFVDLPGEWIE